MYEELDLPHGVKPLSIRWVDKNDHHTAKATLTARGYEQELTGQEIFYSATPQPATLRLLLVVAHGGWGLCSILSPSSLLENRGETWTHGVCSRSCLV